MKKEEIAKASQKITEKILESIQEVVIGKEEVIRKMLICLMANGHILIEDVPGIGKTTLVNALAKAVQLDFRRIQFTPDLMPSDVTGFNLYNPKITDFEFKEGAINTQILLADEINRSSPRTQSALLEAMQEGQVTVEGITYVLPQPFMVLATQNPVEHVGTYPLPEAQMDRFMMRISIGYPSLEEEFDILSLSPVTQANTKIKSNVREEEILWLRQQIQYVHADNKIKHYILDLCRKTRTNPDLSLGVSPRASQMLLAASSARALMMGRDYLIPDDIQALAHDVLDHRVILNPQARGKGLTSKEIIQMILDNTVAPR